MNLIIGRRVMIEWLAQSIADTSAGTLGNMDKNELVVVGNHAWQIIAKREPFLRITLILLKDNRNV